MGLKKRKKSDPKEKEMVSMLTGKLDFIFHSRVSHGNTAETFLTLIDTFTVLLELDTD